jgi:hypothetical protein
MKKLRLAGIIALAAVIGFAMAGCEILIDPPVPTLTGITASYTDTTAIYPTTPLNDLKAGLTVTAQYSDNTSKPVTDYTLSGTLTVGTSAVTVTYEGKTTTFTVTVAPSGDITKTDLSGTVSLSNNSPKVGNTITAAYAPGNGSGAQTWQWFRADGTDDLIPGATTNVYTATAADVGKKIKVLLSFADQNGSLSATTTNAVAAAPSGDPQLSGTISISPDAGVTINTELTATYSGSETISYQWKKDGTNVGTDSDKYTPTEAGSYTVTVSATGYQSKTSAAVIVTGPPVPAQGSTLAEKLQWVKDNAQSYNAYSLEVSADESIAPQTVSCSGRTGVTIILKGDTAERVVSLSSDGPLFSVESGVTLVLDNNITLQGRNNNNVSLVAINSGGALEMKAGAKITGNTATSASPVGGGGVAVRENGTFTMTGGEISGNAVASNVWAGGGGVIVVGPGTFTMQGGKISSNTAIDGGGGVIVVDNGTFTMQGGEISGNSIDADSWANGGGVHVNSGIFTMSGGEISDNTASSDIGGSNGGGVNVSNGATFTMSGTAKISGNTATGDTGSNGGGVFVYQGTFTMTGGEISDNTASSNTESAGGGGVQVDNNATFTMSGTAKISGNTAESDSWAGAGGVAVSGTFTMNGGEISDNIASSNTESAGGGGVNVYDSGTFTMNGGKISDNTATADSWAGGGGVYVGGGTFTMSGGEISDNTVFGKTGTSNGGGVGVYNGGTFTMLGGEISGNTADTDSDWTGGGGVFVESDGIFRIVTGTVYGSEEGAKSNTAQDGAAFNGGNETAQRGTFSGSTWTSKGDLEPTDDTIKVVNGELQ